MLKLHLCVIFFKRMLELLNIVLVLMKINSDIAFDLTLII